MRRECRTHVVAAVFGSLCISRALHFSASRCTITFCTSRHRRELSRVYAARMWQARWRQYVRRKLLNSEDEAIMNAALMSDISGEPRFGRE